MLEQGTLEDPSLLKAFHVGDRDICVLNRFGFPHQSDGPEYPFSPRLELLYGGKKSQEETEDKETPQTCPVHEDQRFVPAVGQDLSPPDP